MRRITIYLEVEEQMVEATFNDLINSCALEVISANRETLMMHVHQGDESESPGALLVQASSGIALFNCHQS